MCAGLFVGVVQAQAIVVGQVGPFTVLPSPDAQELHDGAKAAFAQANRTGGVRGRQLELFLLDDKFNGDEFERQLGVAMQRKPVALITPIGSSALNKLVNEKLLDRYPVVVMNAIPGSEPYRKPGHPRLFHVRASDRQQLEKIVQHVRTLGVTRLAVLHQDLPIGIAGLKVVQALAQQAPLLEVTAAMAKHEPGDITSAANQSVGRQSQAVVVIGSPKFMADGVAALRKAGARGFVFALSYLPAGLVSKVAGAEAARGVAIAQAFPNPNGVSMRLQRDFQAAMRAQNPETKLFTTFQLEGYVSARVLLEGLRRIPGDIDADALTRSLKGLGSLDLGGFYVSFERGNEGSAFVDIGVIDSRGALIY